MKGRTKYKVEIERVFFRSRWKRPFWDRSATWLIFGVYKFWFSNTEYEYTFGFFGFDLRVWMKRTPKEYSNIQPKFNMKYLKLGLFFIPLVIAGYWLYYVGTEAYYYGVISYDSDGYPMGVLNGDYGRWFHLATGASIGTVAAFVVFVYRNFIRPKK